MKSRITGKPADNKSKFKKQEEIIKKGEDITIEDLYELGLIDENTTINAYPMSARNVINRPGN